MWNALTAVMLKELRQTRRDKRTMAMLVIAPAMQLLVLGFAVDLDVVEVPTVVVDLDQTEASREFAAGMLADETFEEVGQTMSPGEAMGQIVSGDASVAVVVPRGFSRDLQRNEPVAVQALIDGGDANRATISQNALSAYSLTWGLQRIATPPGVQLPGRTELRTVIRFNPELDSPTYFVPGIAATLLMVVTTIVAAMGLSREKETGTLEQVMVTPMSPETLLLGKVAPYAVIGLLDLGLVVVVGAAVFEVPVRGGFDVLFAAGALYMLSTLGIGLLASAFAKTQQQAFFNAFFILLPAVLLSGFMTPISNIPEPLQSATVINPMRHFIEAARGVMIKGADYGDLAFPLIGLAVIGAVTFVGSAVLMRARM